MSKIASLAVLIILIAQAPAGAQEAAVMIEIGEPQIVVAGISAQLKDIARVSVLTADGRDGRVVEYRAGSLEVLRFKPGVMEGKVDHVEIKLGLKRLGYTDVSISGPKEVRIGRRSKILDNRRVLDLARSHVRSALAGIDDDARVDFVRRIDPVRIPAGRYSMDVRFEGDPKNPDYIGDADLRLVAEIDGVVEELARVPVRVSRRVAVVRLARDLRSGATVTRDDLVLEEQEVSRLSAQLFKDPEDVLGRIATRDLKSGADLTRADVKARPVVRKEDFVNVRARKGALQVTTLCQALQDGAPGERILFKNLASGRSVEAVVVDRQNAEIDLGR